LSYIYEKENILTPPNFDPCYAPACGHVGMVIASPMEAAEAAATIFLKMDRSPGEVGDRGRRTLYVAGSSPGHVGMWEW